MRITVLVLTLLCATSLAFAQTTPNDPLVDVMPHLLANRFSEAKAELVGARERYRKAGDALGLAQCDFLEGMAEFGAGRETDAIVLLESSQRSLVAAGDPLSATLATCLLVQVLEGEGEIERAEKAAKSGIETLQASARSPQSFRLNGFLRLGTIFGSPFANLIGAGPSLEMMKPIILKCFEAMLHDSLVGVLMEQGELAEAEAEIEKIESFSQLFGGMFDSSIASHRGDLLRRQWRLDEARESYQRALTSIEPIPFLNGPQDSRQQTRVMAELATIDQLAGRFVEALAWNEKALALARSDGDRRREVRILGQRGELLAQQGRSEEAKASWTQALAIATDSGDAYGLASTHSKLGFRDFLQGNLGSAASHLEKSVALYRSIDEPGLANLSVAPLTEVYLLLGSPESAGQVLPEAGATLSCLEPIFARFRAVLARAIELNGGAESDERIKQLVDELAASGREEGSCIDSETWNQVVEVLRQLVQGPRPEGDSVHRSAPDPNCEIGERLGFPLCTQVLIAQGRAAMSRGDLVAAIPIWKEALARARASHLGDFVPGIEAVLGSIHLRLGDLAAAEENLREASAGLDRVASTVQADPLLTSYLGSGRNIYHELLAEVLARQGKWREAFEVSERARSRGLALALGNPRVRLSDSTDRQLFMRFEGLSRTLNGWERSMPLLPERERKSREEDLVHARDDLEGLLARLRVTQPEYASIVNGEPVKIEEIQRSLGDADSVVSYLVTPLGVHAWVIDREHFAGITLPIAPGELAEVSCFAAEQRLHATDRGFVIVDAKTCSPGKDRARELYSKLVAPLRPYLHRERITLLPYGALHSIPFAALRDPDSGRYLVEEFTLTYAPSASVIPFLRAKESPFEGKALVLGDPKSPDAQLSSLKGARQEVARVARLFGVDPLLGARATETRLRTQAAGVDLLHLAAHARFDPRNPGFSRLVLAADSKNDGYLEAHEISSELDLEGVNLVVLSACETAVGARSGGDEVLGLARAFIYAGTPGVVATLWRVDDAATARLMDTFYAGLAKGASPAAALREAQLALAHDPDTADPSYWAAFILVGDPQYGGKQREAVTGQSSGRGMP